LTLVNRAAKARADTGAMKRSLLPLLAAAALAAGCTSLLPHGSSTSPTPFASFAVAEAAAARIVPFETRVDQLKALGFDADGGKNVTVIPYPDLLTRLVPYSGVPMESLDRGIRECIAARDACRAWVFHFEQLERQREGPFLADFFNLRRVTQVKGWTADVLVVASNGKVLFRNVTGQAQTDRTERQVNPLGPFQSGESLLR
jgi:hypothetical protein